jgi:hypothetical protein
MRIITGLQSLSRKYEPGAIDAYEKAWQSRGFRYRIAKRLLEHRAATQTLEFLETHPMIRPLEDYADFVHHAFQKG